MPDFLLPDLGEGLEEAELVAWRVQVGDRVAVDQVVAEVETAKAAVEIPIPFAGVVSALHAEPGATVAVGAPLVTVTPLATAQPGFREPGVTAAASDGAAEDNSGSVLVGYGTSSTPRRNRSRVARGASSRREPTVTSGVPPSTMATTNTRPVAVISPLVRKLARDGGLDLTAVVGTGPGGLVRRTDVERALSAVRDRRSEPAATQLRPSVPTGSPDARGGNETRIPLRGVRKAVADKLSRSRREIPEATVWVDVDATEFVAARALLNRRQPASPVSVTALLARFTILGLHQYPELNARIELDDIVIPECVHLGFAAQTDRGLVVPVVRDAHRLTTRGLSAAVAKQAAAARSGSLSPADLTGGTFTVNNYGVFGVDGSAAIINHPEVAILGMGRIIDRSWVVNGQLTVRKVGQLSLAFDHRVCDGGTAGGFLRYIADCVEAPVAAIWDL